MKCPFCQGEMQTGCINSYGSAPALVYWLPQAFCDMHAFPPVSMAAIQKAGGFWLTSGFSLVSRPDPVYVCRSCGKLIADLPDDKKKR